MPDLMRFSPEMQQLLQELIVIPYQSQSTLTWQTQVLQNNGDYCRKTLLEQGRVDFTQSKFGLIRFPSV